MTEPELVYIKGQGWVYAAKPRIEILDHDGTFALVNAKDVPEGVARTTVSAAYYTPREALYYLKMRDLTKVGPPESASHRRSGWWCVVKLADVT